MTIIAIVLLCLLIAGFVISVIGKGRLLFDIAVLITLVFLLFGVA
jgi:hypothetical protein